MPFPRLSACAVLAAAALPTFAQTARDTTGTERFSAHAQGTEVVQYKPAFHAPYSGPNSLSPEEETRTSITTTLFLGARPWHGAGLYFNPELAGDPGLSGALGVASSTNDETWAFTGIDHQVSAGVVLNGGRWHRANDQRGPVNVLSLRLHVEV